MILHHVSKVNSDYNVFGFFDMYSLQLLLDVYSIFTFALF